VISLVGVCGFQGVAYIAKKRDVCAGREIYDPFGVVVRMVRLFP
jgi:hypothetical protein